MNLEHRYRRILALYPAEHRRHYEAEMIGVLMASSRPGQRFPAPGEAADLVLAALRTRVTRALRVSRQAAWRDAGAVLGLLGAVLLAAVALTRLGEGLWLRATYGDAMDAALLLDVGLRSAAWSAVAGAALLGARRTAAGLAVAAAAVEIGVLSWWLPVQPDRVVTMSWLPAVMVLVVGGLFLARRGGGAVLGRRGLAAAVAGVVLVAVSRHHWALGWLPWRLTDDLSVDGAGPPTVPSLVTMAAGLPVLWALWRLRRRVRRRLVALAVPALMTPAVADAVHDGFGAPLTAPQAALLVTVPVLALFWGVVAVHRWEGRGAA